jgi:hypothetical protein
MAFKEINKADRSPIGRYSSNKTDRSKDISPLSFGSSLLNSNENHFAEMMVHNTASING